MAHTLRKHPDHGRDGYAEAAYAGNTPHLIGAHGNSADCHFWSCRLDVLRSSRSGLDRTRRVETESISDGLTFYPACRRWRRAIALGHNMSLRRSKLPPDLPQQPFRRPGRSKFALHKVKFVATPSRKPRIDASGIQMRLPCRWRNRKGVSTACVACGCESSVSGAALARIGCAFRSLAGAVRTRRCA